MKSEWLDMQYNKDVEHWFIVEDGQVRFIFNDEWFELYISEECSYPCRLQYLNTCDHIKGRLRVQLRTNYVYKIGV